MAFHFAIYNDRAVRSLAGIDLSIARSTRGIDKETAVLDFVPGSDMDEAQ